MHPILVIFATFVGSLVGTATPQSTYQPAEKGTWYLAGGSSALFESVDGGDYGDSDFLGFSVTGGAFVVDGLLLRGTLEWTTSTAESGGLDLDEDTYTVTAGLRYYLSRREVARPYLGVAAGMGSLDQEVDNGAMGVLSDEDSYPIYQGELGLEIMISHSVGIDVGLVGRQASDVELFGSRDDVTSLGLVVGSRPGCSDGAAALRRRRSSGPPPEHRESGAPARVRPVGTGARSGSGGRRRTPCR